MFDIREVHQIEITTRCNLRCKYCPHPQLERPKADMTLETLDAALDFVSYYCKKGTQTEVSLTGLGEGILHPDFLEICRRVRDTIGWNRLICFSTNGIGLTEEICRELRPLGVGIFISLHRPEKAGPAVEAAKKYELLMGVNGSFATSAYDWAGQVKWFNSGPQIPCPNLQRGWVVVLQDGSISSCCWDAHGKNILGTVWDDPNRLQLKTFPLCNQCHHSLPEGFERATN